MSGWQLPRRHIGMLVDRCIPPSVARALDLIPMVRAVSLAEMYGDACAQQLDDELFLEEAGRRGWIVLTSNFKMWRVAAQREAIVANHTRVFALANGQLSVPAQALVFGRWVLSMRRRAQRCDACFWRLHLGATRKDRR